MRTFADASSSSHKNALPKKNFSSFIPKRNDWKKAQVLFLPQLITRLPVLYWTTELNMCQSRALKASLVSKLFCIIPNLHKFVLDCIAVYWRVDGLPLKYDMMIFVFRKLSGFRIFPDFHLIFRFLHRMYGLLLTYDMMISFSGYFSGFSSNLQISSQNRWFNLSNMIWWLIMIFVFRNYPVSRFFPDFSRFSSYLQISSQNVWFTSHIWYDDFIFRIFIKSSDFFTE